LRTNQYQPMQFYLVTEEMEREWLGQGASTTLAAPLSASEEAIVARSISEVDGKMTMEVLMGFGLSDTQARDLTARYEARGWVEKDRRQGNARYITQKLRDLVTNQQSPQSAPKPENRQQTASNRPQTQAQPPSASPLSPKFGEHEFRGIENAA
jgi:hypothetical protein